MNKPLIYYYTSDKLKKACTDLLEREGNILLEYKLEQLRINILDLYDIVADVALLELFGKDFIYDNPYSLYRLYELHYSREERNRNNWTKHICRCYKRWIINCNCNLYDNDI